MKAHANSGESKNAARLENMASKRAALHAKKERKRKISLGSVEVHNYDSDRSKYQKSEDKRYGYK